MLPRRPPMAGPARKPIVKADPSSQRRARAFREASRPQHRRCGGDHARRGTADQPSTNNQPSDGAKAMNRKSQTDRRARRAEQDAVQRSDSSLNTGPARKPIRAAETANVIPLGRRGSVAAGERLQRLGNTATMMPMEIAQATALTKTKPNAAVRRPAVGGAGSVASATSRT